jgi:hypothetical protein
MCGLCGMAGGSQEERMSFVTASSEFLSHRGTTPTESPTRRYP